MCAAVVDSKEPIVVTLPAVWRRERALLDSNSDLPSMLSRTSVLHLVVGSLGILNRFANGFSEPSELDGLSPERQGNLPSHSTKAGCGMSFVLLRK